MSDDKFNFDLKEMKKALSGDRILVPRFDNFDEFQNWLDTVDVSFNFDLDEMKKSLEEEKHDFPEFDTVEEYEAWLDKQ